MLISAPLDKIDIDKEVKKVRVNYLINKNYSQQFKDLCNRKGWITMFYIIYPYGTKDVIANTYTSLSSFYDINHNELNSLIDTYSLGLLIPYLFYDYNYILIATSCFLKTKILKTLKK